MIENRNGLLRKARGLVLVGAMAILALPIHGRADEGSGDPPIAPVSQLKGFRFIPLAKLPAASHRADAESCTSFVVQPASPAGRAVKERGWSVTGEAKVGLLQAVSFASRLEGGTSGTCLISDGNVGLFDGTRLMALAYAEPGSKQTIGRVAALDNGTVRVWDGDFLSRPVGDIELTDASELKLGQLASEDALCGGKAVVPNIYDMPIDKARAALAAKGWKPVPGDASARPADFGTETDLVKKGIVEVDGCSGTGMAYCSFNYSAAGASLSVTTAGEDELPEVVGYEATCQ